MDGMKLQPAAPAHMPRALAEFVCILLVHNFVTVFPGAQGIKEQLLSNYQ